MDHEKYTVKFIMSNYAQFVLFIITFIDRLFSTEYIINSINTMELNNLTQEKLY